MTQPPPAAEPARWRAWLRYFAHAFPKAEGFSSYRMPGPAFHLSFIVLMAALGLAICFSERGTAPLLAVWIVVGVYAGRDLTSLAHYYPVLVLLWLAGLLAALFMPEATATAFRGLRAFVAAYWPAAPVIATAALLGAFALWVRHWSRAYTPST